MSFHKVPNSFYKMVLPVRILRSYKKKCWRILDGNNKIIADSLTKELAETLIQAVNLCAPAISFTKLFVESESFVGYHEDISPEGVIYRNTIYTRALEFMIDLELIEPPPKYVDLFPAWKKEMINNFQQDILDMRHTQVKSADDYLTEFFKPLAINR